MPKKIRLCIGIGICPDLREKKKKDNAEAPHEMCVGLEASQKSADGWLKIVGNLVTRLPLGAETWCISKTKKKV